VREFYSAAYKCVQIFRTELGVPLQHLPVLVSRHERNLLDRQACLEQAAGALVPKVMEVKVFDL